MKDLKMSDAPHLFKIENALTRALAPFKNPETEGALAALACIRVAKQILSIYPATTRGQILPAMLNYLADRPQPGTEENLIWTPPNHFGPIDGN